jgi:hypothetical protein
MYYGLLMIPYLAVVCGTMLVAHVRTRSRPAADERMAAAVLVALAIVLAAAVPLGRAYLGAHKVVGERGREEVVNGSATMLNYLGPPPENVLYGKSLERFAVSERRLFPGFGAMALAVVGIVSSRGTRKDGNTKERKVHRLAYVLGLLVSFDISLGYNGFTYPILYEYFFPFRALRIPARNGIIVGLSVAVLAGYGAARVAASGRSAAVRRVILVVIGALIAVEYLSRPLPQVAIPLTPPAAYDIVLADKGDSPTTAIFEFPLSSKDDPTYMYYSTFHWQHLVNGYSGFFPPSYVFLANAVENIPDDASIHAIKSHGARYLLVHGERLLGNRYEELTAQLNARPELKLISRTPSEREGQHGEISVYRVSYQETK